jgi:hypothetical protein
MVPESNPETATFSNRRVLSLNLHFTCTDVVIQTYVAIHPIGADLVRIERRRRPSGGEVWGRGCPAERGRVRNSRVIFLTSGASQAIPTMAQWVSSQDLGSIV